MQLLTVIELHELMSYDKNGSVKLKVQWPWLGRELTTPTSRAMEVIQDFFHQLTLSSDP